MLESLFIKLQEHRLQPCIKRDSGKRDFSFCKHDLVTISDYKHFEKFSGAFNGTAS